MKRLMYFTMCLCTMLLVVSCSKSNSDNPLIGKWEQTIEQAGGKAVLTYDFKDSGNLPRPW